MSDDGELTRRDFVRWCASAAALAAASPALLAEPGARLHRYERVRLLDERDRPITPSALKVGESYLFYYPYLATPCFLLNLGKTAKDAALQTEDGRAYRSGGGVGPRHSVVAFSAICAHKLSHPARAVSFINYRHRPTSFQNAEHGAVERGQIIYCCSEKSVYDPLDGARVLGGPAKQPLTAIALEADSQGALCAVGTLGGELYDLFFERFSSRLALEFRTNDVRKLVVDTATVKPLASYCKNQVLC